MISNSDFYRLTTSGFTSRWVRPSTLQYFRSLYNGDACRILNYYREIVRDFWLTLSQGSVCTIDSPNKIKINREPECDVIKLYLFSFCCSDCLVQVLFVSRTTVLYKAKTKAHITYITHDDVASQRSQHSTSQETLLQSWNSHSKAYLETLAKILDTPAREVARSHSSCILS